MTLTSTGAIRIIAVITPILAIGCGSASTPTTPSTATVTAVTVTSAPTSPSSIQLTAVARLSDGTSRDVTSLATWVSSNVALASVSPNGLVTVFGTGEVDVRATYQSVTGSAHLVVTKLPIVSLSLIGAPASASTSFQLTATARMADGSAQDVTQAAAWESSNPAVAAVSTTGFVTVLGDGEADIRASYQGMNASAHVKVALARMFTLSGVVSEAAPNAGPIAGARVQVIGGGSTITDERGAFAIQNLSGRVLVEVSKPGYQVIEKDFTLTADAQWNVALQRMTTTAISER